MGTTVRDRFDEVMGHIQDHAFSKGDYAGVPIPVEGMRLEVCEGYPHPSLAGYYPDPEEPGDAEDPTFLDYAASMGWTVVNNWLDRRRNAVVYTYHNDAKQYGYDLIPLKKHHTRRLTLDLCTLGASRVWDLEAEAQAQLTLQELVTPVAFRYYQLVGGFLETSKRSGVTYWFRRCRPTVALRGNLPLCALCLHPIAYYYPSHAGCMVPTDDLIAHLLMMRSDEHLFWKRANHHPCDQPEAAI